MGTCLERARAVWLQCLDRDKVQPVAAEVAEEEAVKLARTNSLWALVVFDTAGNDTLDPFVKYRIRYVFYFFLKIWLI